MQQHWFYDVWAFIGAGGAIVMVAILLTTDTFRSNPTVSRWRDAVWLAWLAAPLYWVHQLEEYSLPVMGLPYSLPDMVCGQFDFPPYPDCPIPMSFYPVVNISVVYGAVVGFTPIILAALASRFFKPELLQPVSALPASA
jgi:hypothetical protein